MFMKKGLILCFMFFVMHLTYSQSFSEADRLILEGAQLHDQKKYEEAISKYQQALKLNPNSISALYEIALSYLQMEDYDNAVKYSSQVIKLGFKPMLIDAYTVKGTALANSNRLDEAIKMFAGALEETGDNYLLNYNLGLAYYNHGDKKLAHSYIRKAINLDPTHADAFLIYAYVLSDLDMWIQSVYSYQFFLLQEPNTERSAKAFKQMFKLLTDVSVNEINASDTKLGLASMYAELVRLKANVSTEQEKYTYFRDASVLIFSKMDSILKENNFKQKGIFWDFFVPIFSELIYSGHFDTYTRYISACYFLDSANWWEKHEIEVHDFKVWFEHGIEDDELVGDESEEYTIGLDSDDTNETFVGSEEESEMDK